MSKLSTKDLSALSDLLNYEKWASMKSQLYSETMQDAEIKGFCKKLQDGHNKNFNEMFNFLNSQ